MCGGGKRGNKICNLDALQMLGYVLGNGSAGVSPNKLGKVRNQ